MPRTMKETLIRVFTSNLSMPMAQPRSSTATGVVAYGVMSEHVEFCLALGDTNLQHLDESHAQVKVCHIAAHQ